MRSGPWPYVDPAEDGGAVCAACGASADPGGWFCAACDPFPAEDGRTPVVGAIPGAGGIIGWRWADGWPIGCPSEITEDHPALVRPEIIERDGGTLVNVAVSVVLDGITGEIHRRCGLSEQVSLEPIPWDQVWQDAIADSVKIHEPPESDKRRRSIADRLAD